MPYCWDNTTMDLYPIHKDIIRNKHAHTDINKKTSS